MRTKYAVVCRVKDPGQGFSLDEVRHASYHKSPRRTPATSRGAKETGVAAREGFGILLAKHIVDEMIYGESGNDVI